MPRTRGPSPLSEAAVGVLVGVLIEGHGATGQDGSVRGTEAAAASEPRVVGVEELFAAVRHPFVRHQVDPDDVHGVVLCGEAAVVDCNRRRTGADPGAPTLWCLGPAEQLTVALAASEQVFSRPARICVAEAAYDAVPAAWHFDVRGHWHWQLTRTPPPPQPREDEVVEVHDGAAVGALLDVGNPGSFGRPGAPGIECWLGTWEGGTLTSVGALYRDPDGTGHLRAVTTHPAYAGKGLGTAVSAALTRRAMAGASATATLGVYVDNAPALAVYARLGYRTEVTFKAGQPSC